MSSTHRFRMPLLLVAVLALTAVSTRAGVKPTQVPYPEGYRTWPRVKTLAILSPAHALHSAFGGIHHVYANPKALQAVQNGGPYPDGSVLVFDLMTADTSGGVVAEGARKFSGVMRKDQTAYASTGGWGFEGFAGDSRTERLVKDAATQCFGCHLGQKARGYVFSEWQR